MTEEYRNQFFSRILKLNFTQRPFIIKAVKILLICIFSALAGYFLHFAFPAENGATTLIKDHFSTFFENFRLKNAVATAVTFTLFDTACILFTASLGFTMLSGIIGKAVIMLCSARLGTVISYIVDILFYAENGSVGMWAFILFVISKAIVLFALIFTEVKSEFFSYEFCEIFEKKRHPFLEKSTINYLIFSASTAGFTVIINTLYLLFRYLMSI